jgi:hypothetical protein
MTTPLPKLRRHHPFAKMQACCTEGARRVLELPRAIPAHTVNFSRGGRGCRPAGDLVLQRHFLMSTLLILRLGGVSSVPRGVSPHGSCDRTGHVGEVPLQY